MKNMIKKMMIAVEGEKEARKYEKRVKRKCDKNGESKHWKEETTAGKRWQIQCEMIF